MPAVALHAEKPSPTPKKEANPAKKEASSAKKEAKKDTDASKTEAVAVAKKDKDSADSGDNDPMAENMKQMILGQDMKGLSYAHRDENDKLVMEFDTEIARKLDDENIEMENLKIIAYDEDGKKIDIAIPKSVFNLPTRILNGKDQIVIKREDFEIVGETGEFNTKTRFAKMFGNVKMTILNTENLNK